jgi:mannose-6-phosphate isomerase-like protein (cupin superfamily)
MPVRHSVVFAALLFAAGSVRAQQPAATPATDVPVGFELWSADHVKEVSDRLEKNIGNKDILFETMGNWKGHSVYLVLRTTTADAEFHQTEEDLYFGVRGNATFVIGGEMVDSKRMPRKQMRSATIRGGAKRELHAGDVVHVPRAVPHQIVLAPGERFMYFLIKLDEEPLQNLNPHTLTPEKKK